MPGLWLERWLPSPARSLGRAYSASTRWGLPLGSLLTTAADEIDHAALPRSVIADQIGSCLALAVGHQPAVGTRHRGKLAQRLLRLIEERHADPGLDPGEVARALGISTRYLHALLAESGATFSAALNRVRLTRASEMLADVRLDGLQVAEISWRCGYLDPSYFTRVFRQRFGACPREWRKRQRN
jgi:AraC-like DNA-binding protein